MKSFSCSLVSLIAVSVVGLSSLPLHAADAALETKPADAYFEKFQPHKAPAPTLGFLHRGDRLAICGDSITEQKMYSRVMETYLTHLTRCVT